MKNKLEMIVAKNIRTYRKLAHLSQASLAEKINRTPEIVCKIENNKVGIACHMIDCIAEALNVDSYLLTIPDTILINNITPETLSFIQTVQKLPASKISLLIALVKTWE